MVQFVESSYKFTDPIRYFKANDPIYYEVENIPLKQLQENDLWIKDQLDKLNANSFGGNTPGEIDRSSFSELKPYVDGSNNIVKVRPGRFTARINDAYNITPLQYIRNITGSAINTTESWTAVAAQDMMISSVINRFRSNVVSQALNMNGLVERAFSYPAQIPDRASSYLASGSPTVNAISTTADNQFQPLYPLRQVQLWNVFTFGENNETTFNIRQYDNNNAVVGFASINSAESEFIKRWRGVARTAVVDLAEETSIEIPRFNADDFYYIDSTNTRQLLSNASQRIDLLFIYSKPVDMSGTTIAKFLSTGQPTTITTPTLGIVYGAGVGLNFRSATQQFKRIENGTLTGDNYGSLKMLAHIGDQAGQNTGFKVSGVEVKGSFPSPDDLMNLTPILDEELTTNHFGLIGQSILPLAYIVVKRNAQVNDNGINRITTNDVIDIRPFFRTTELSYNERAGIAAAVPSLSLANPVVTQSELKYEVNRAYKDLLNRIPVPPTTDPGRTTIPDSRPIKFGYVMGGLKYGPEGALANAIAADNSADDENAISLKVAKKYYTSGVTVPITPDWDVATWNPNTSKIKANDCLNVYQFTPNYNSVRAVQRSGRGPYETFFVNNNNLPNKYSVCRNDTGRWNNGTGWDQRLGHIPVPSDLNTTPTIHFHFVRKKIYLNNTDLPQNAIDYDVNVKLLNCINMSHLTVGEGVNPAAANNIWIEKGIENEQHYFVINVAWPAKKLGYRDQTANHSDIGNVWVDNNNYSPQGYATNIGMDLDPLYNNAIQYVVDSNGGSLDPRGYRNAGELTAGWLATSEDIIKFNYTGRESKGKMNMAICIYPTVQYSIIAYTDGSYLPASPPATTA